MQKRWRVLIYSMFSLTLLLITVLGVSAVFANGGPHAGTFTTTTTSCAGCHRAHTGTAADLLMSTSQYALCMTCHGTSGSGADTNVADGVYRGSTNGTPNAGLKGGGFVNAKMNTLIDGTDETGAISKPVTSKHTIDATNATAWGSGTSGNGEAVSLQCGNCHNPHGNTNYRILRGQPTSLLTLPTPSVGVDNTTAVTYTVVYNAATHYRDLGVSVYGNAVNNIGEWCSQCHSRYKAASGAGSSSAGVGSAPFEYRHMTNATTPGAGALRGECFSCHVAHGTTAAMTGYSAAVNWPGGAAAAWQTGTEGQHSRLLTVDNRGVCIQCHSETVLSAN